MLVPGALVFRPPGHPVNLRDPRNWWSWVPGAQWRHPEGPGSSTDGRERHPVTQVAWADAAACAAWAGKALPTEAEWERAARGGLDGATFSWGNEARPGGRVMANTWHGRFPWENLKAPGNRGTTAVGQFPPNGFGLSDMTGNVWEWTADFYAPRHAAGAPACCVPRDPRVDLPGQSFSQALPDRASAPGGRGRLPPVRPNYRLRCRPAARQARPSDGHGPPRLPLRAPGGGGPA